MTLLEKLADLCVTAPPLIAFCDEAPDKLSQLIGVLAQCASPGAAVEAMKALRKHVYENVSPERLTTVMRDYMTDEGMWEWVDEFDPAYVHAYDFEAAYWAVTSIVEISLANKVLEKHNVC